MFFISVDSKEGYVQSYSLAKVLCLGGPQVCGSQYRSPVSSRRFFPTDWRAPSGSTLARISDRRARRFWGPKHLVSLHLSRIRMAKHGQQEPACCQDEGFYWDEAILYAPKTEWKEMPVSVFWNDPEIGKLFPASKTRSGTIDDAIIKTGVMGARNQHEQVRGRWHLSTLRISSAHCWKAVKHLRPNPKYSIRLPRNRPAAARPLHTLQHRSTRTPA